MQCIRIGAKFSIMFSVYFLVSKSNFEQSDEKSSQPSHSCDTSLPNSVMVPSTTQNVNCKSSLASTKEAISY